MYDALIIVSGLVYLCVFLYFLNKALDTQKEYEWAVVFPPPNILPYFPVVVSNRQTAENMAKNGGYVVSRQVGPWRLTR